MGEAMIPGGVYAFYTSKTQVSNREPTDGSGGFTDFTDFTPLGRGVYVAPTRPAAPGRARSRPANTYTPSNRRKIRKIRKTGRRRGRISGRFDPPGVKSVKRTPVSDAEVTG